MASQQQEHFAVGGGQFISGRVPISIVDMIVALYAVYVQPFLLAWI
jgi:hypothetical protein